MFMCLQSFPNFIWWTPAAFSGIFAHRSKTVTPRECKCSYLGTALPSFLAQNRKNKGCIQRHGTAALAEVWGALSSLCGCRGCSETPLPCPEQRQHPAQCEPTKTLSCLMATSSFHPIPTASSQQLHAPHRTKNPLRGGVGVGHCSAGANSAWAASSYPPLSTESRCPTTQRLLRTKNQPTAPAGNGRSRQKAVSGWAGLRAAEEGRSKVSEGVGGGKVGLRCPSGCEGRACCGLSANRAHLHPWRALLHPRILLPWPLRIFIAGLWV